MEQITEALEPEIQKILEQLRHKLQRQQDAAETTRKHIQLLGAKQTSLLKDK